MKAATVMIVLLVCVLSIPVEVSAANTIDFYHSYAVENNVEVGRVAKSVWVVRWVHNEVIITEGLEATVTGNLPLEYSAEYGGWVAYDVRFGPQSVSYSIESAYTSISWLFIQTAPDVQVLFYVAPLWVSDTSTITDSTTTEVPFPPVYPEVFNTTGLAFALFVGAIITVLWKVNKDLGD